MKIKMFNMYRSSLLFVLVMAFPFSAHRILAQQYYVNFESDTIPGKFNIDTYHFNAENIEFKNPYNNRITLTPYNAKSIHYSDEINYRSVIYQGKRYFMQVIYEGPLSVYYLSHGSELSSYVLVKTDSESIEINTSTFKTDLPDFLNECPEIQNKIKNKDYKYKDKDFYKIAKEYETCAANMNNTPARKFSFDDLKAGVVLSSANLKKEDIYTLLGEMQKKYNSKEEIPGYMWTSLLTLLSADKDLTEKAESAKKQLDQ